jgi:signal peptidase I
MRKHIAHGRVAILTLILLLLSGCLLNPRRTYQALTKRIVKVPTEAMSPTIKAGTHAVVDEGYYAQHPVERYDMVEIEDPDGTREQNGNYTFYIKRIIALGGETVQLKGGATFINGQELKEPFNFHPEPQVDYGPIVVPVGEYFLLGDNRQNSMDSRYWKKHTIDKSYIHGKVIEVVQE